MDALARLEPVARDLLRRVDGALVTLGAPPQHPVWPLLRRLGATPADALAFFAGVDEAPVRATAASLRDRAEAYEAADVPAGPPWRGPAGDAFGAHAADLRAHLAGGSGPAGDSMAARLRATAACVDDVADWCHRSRDALARTLAEVVASAQAVTVRSHPDLSDLAAPRVPVAAVAAAADIGARVLAAAAEAVAEGEALDGRWRAGLHELAFRRGAEGPVRHGDTIEVHPA
jgi:hypothetical protein